LLATKDVLQSEKIIVLSTVGLSLLLVQVPWLATWPRWVVSFPQWSNQPDSALGHIAELEASGI